MLLLVAVASLFASPVAQTTCSDLSNTACGAAASADAADADLEDSVSMLQTNIRDLQRKATNVEGRTNRFKVTKKETQVESMKPEGGSNANSSSPQACMLVPVHPPHFEVLNVRIMMTQRTNTGPTVKTVVVFGDRNEHNSFCAQFPKACASDTGFHGITLESILGLENFIELKQVLGMEGHGEQHFFERYSGERYGCWAKTEGRVFQTIKKFYGAAYGPKECDVYWVSDAESLPFRKHHLQKLMGANLEKPSIVLASWRNEESCQNVHADYGTDMSCAVMLGSLSNGLRWMNDTAPTIWTREYYERAYWFVDQWWMYRSQTVRLWLNFLESVTNKKGWYLLAWLRMTDASVYGMMMEWASTYATPDQITIRNIRAVIMERHPRAFETCCKCNAGSDSLPPCIDINDLLGSNSCLENMIPVLDRIHLVVEGLGIFGVGNYLHLPLVNSKALDTEDSEGRGVHWCYNNCFTRDTFSQLVGVKGADTAGLTKYKGVFNTTVVMAQKSTVRSRHMQLESNTIDATAAHTPSHVIDSAVPFGVCVANAIGTVMVVLAFACMSVSDEKSSLRRICSIMCYLTFSVLIDANISAASKEHNGFKFEPACSVLLVETGKLIVSTILYIVNRWNHICDGKPFLQEEMRLKDISFLAIPGLLFALNNIFIYFSIGFNDMASFAVFRDTIVFFNAALWCWVFRCTLGMRRNLALSGVFLGLVINQSVPLIGNQFSYSVAIVLCMTFTNACASVTNEYAIKQNSDLDLNLQNAVLYCFCVCWALVYIAVLKPSRLSSLGAFFENIGTSVWLIIALQMCVGLIVSRILKYADSVTKNVANSLRGPIMIILAPILGLDSRFDFVTGISAIIVGSSVCYFLMQGMPQPSIELKKQASEQTN